MIRLQWFILFLICGSSFWAIGFEGSFDGSFEDGMDGSLIDVQMVDGLQSRLSLDEGMLFFRDPSGSLSFHDVLTLPISQFQRATERADVHFGYTSDVLWLRKTLQTNQSDKLDWLWVFESAYLDRISLYVLQSGRWSVLHSGGTLPVPERVVAHRQSVFPLTLSTQEPLTVFVRIKAMGSMSLNSALWEPEVFYRESERTSMVMALYYGMLLALGLYNVLLFLGTGRLTFLLYSGFVFSFSVGVLTLNGVGPVYLWPMLGDFNNRLLPFGFTVSVTFAFFFARRFLHTYRYSPRWDWVLLLGGCTAALASILALWVPMSWALRTMSIAGLLTTVLLLSCGFHSAIRRVPGARIFVLAWLMLLLGTSLLALRNLGILPSNWLTMYSIQIGSALEMLLLSFGLAARFNQLKKEKEQAQENVVIAMKEQEGQLERMVFERTQALEQANAQLSYQASHDTLTTLLNRSGLFQQLDVAILRAVRQRHSLAVLLLDLDGFKPVNDDFGHDAGDRVLQIVAERLRECARETDFIARLGGDEFVLVLEAMTSEQDVEQFAQRILLALQQPMLLDSNGVVAVSACIGVALTAQRCDAPQLLKLADTAMYYGKRAGKSQVRVLTWPPIHKE